MAIESGDILSNSSIYFKFDSSGRMFSKSSPKARRRSHIQHYLLNRRLARQENLLLVSAFDYSFFPANPLTLLYDFFQVDKQLESGEYFMNDQKKADKKWQEKQEKQSEKSAEKKRKRDASFLPPEVSLFLPFCCHNIKTESLSLSLLEVF